MSNLVTFTEMEQMANAIAASIPVPLTPVSLVLLTAKVTLPLSLSITISVMFDSRGRSEPCSGSVGTPLARADRAPGTPRKESE
jgi:hypothetical protein